MISKNWVDVEVAFYDFMWEEGLKAHAHCVNEKIINDFREGKDSFEEIKEKIAKTFPTREKAIEAFVKSMLKEAI